MSRNRAAHSLCKIKISPFLYLWCEAGHRNVRSEGIYGTQTDLKPASRGLLGDGGFWHWLASWLSPGGRRLVHTHTCELCIFISCNDSIFWLELLC